MSMTLMAKAMAIKTGNPLRKLVLIKLADNANDSGECWPSYRHIADHCECSRSAVREHVGALIALGLLAKVNRIGTNNGKGNASNVYTLNLDAPVSPKNIPPVPVKTMPVPAESTPPVSGDGTRTSHSFDPIIDPKAVVEGYNDLFAVLLPVATLDADRRSMINRLATHMMSKSTGAFLGYFEKFRNTAPDFYFGGENGTGWHASFDYLMKPETLRKTREGAL